MAAQKTFYTIYLIPLLAAAACYLAWSLFVPTSATMFQGPQPARQVEASSIAPPSGEVQDKSATGLLDHHGFSFNFKKLEGKAVVLNFIFTRCPSICPKQTEALARVYDQLTDADRAQVHFVSVTIDPEHDSPARLRKFAQEQEVDFEHWSFVSGPMADIKAINRDFSSQELPEGAQALDHRTEVRLIGAQGRLLQTYRGSPLDEARLAREIHAALELTRTSKR